MGQKLDTPEKEPAVKEDPEAEIKAAREALRNAWKKYEWHHEPDLTEISEDYFPVKSRCHVVKVSNIGLLEDAEGKIMTFTEDGKEEYTPKPDEHVLRLVCMSDTHDVDANYWIENNLIPEGDIFLFAGDFTGKGTVQEIYLFTEFLQKLSFKHKIVIAGNHDLVLDREYYELGWKNYHKEKEGSPDEALAKLKEQCTYLEEEIVEVEGLRIFGSPRSLEFMGWAFPIFPDDIYYWDRVIHKASGAEPVDIVLTHGPAIGHGSKCYNGSEAGDEPLLNTLKTKYVPALAVTGHVHEGYGCSQEKDSGTVFLNASSLDRVYRHSHRCMVVEIAVPNK